MSKASDDRYLECVLALNAYNTNHRKAVIARRQLHEKGDTSFKFVPGRKVRETPKRLQCLTAKDPLEIYPTPHEFFMRDHYGKPLQKQCEPK